MSTATASMTRVVLVASMAGLVVAGVRLWANHLEAEPPHEPRTAPPMDTTPGEEGDPGATAADLHFNPDWVGAPCEHDLDCPYEGGFCLMQELGYPGGSCTRECQRYCPDKHGDLYSTTLCVEDTLDGAGLCHARCNFHLTASGCRPGYVCTSTSRIGGDTTQLVCLPFRGTPAPPTDCTRDLDALGIRWSHLDLQDDPTIASPRGGQRPQQDACQVDTPVLLASPVRGVDYRRKDLRHADSLLVSCPMARSLEALSRSLAGLGVVEVEHLGTYHCRGVARTATLSGHGHARAIDIAGFERAEGEPVSVLADWSGPDPERRAFLRQVVEAITATGKFRKVLTPDADADHRDHLHVELR